MDKMYGSHVTMYYLHFCQLAYFNFKVETQQRTPFPLHCIKEYHRPEAHITENSGT
jgi:hypothetical protein